jgi:PAS domain S-box-containing protein
MAEDGCVLYVSGGDGDGATAADRLDDAIDPIAVRAVATADDAVELLGEGSVECVVARHPLPEGDGLRLLSRVRDVDPALPFVLHPADGSEELASDAIDAGVSAYVPGSADVERLARAVTDAMAGSQAGDRDRESSRVADLLRRVESRLVRARTVDAVDRGVCEAIVDTDPYAFAWIGEYDEETQRVRPRAWAGFEAGYLDDVEVGTGDGPLGRGPTGRAVQSHAVEVVQDIPDEPAYEPWRADALERSYRSSAAVPLVHEERLYGVLNVYADRVGAFDPAENALLADLGETVGHALHRVHIQEQLEAQYRELFEEAPVMVALTRDTPDGRIIDDCNQRFAEKLGWSPAALRDRPLTDVYTEASAAKLEAENGYERALEGEFVTTERTLRTRDGDRLHALLQATPRRNADGELVGTHALYVDVTDRRRAQQVVEQADAMEASMDGMAIVDESGTFVYANQAHADVYGYDDPDVFVGETWRMLYDEAETERFESSVLPTIRDGTEWRGEATGLCADGSTFPQEVSLTPLPDGGHVCVVRDITDRRRYERRLERQRDNLEILNQVVRHDVRNDLQIVLGYAESLDDFLDADGAGSEHVEQVVRSARDAVEITETAGEVARVMLTADAETRPVGLGHVLDAQIGQVRSAYDNVVLTTEGTIPDVEVLADDMLGSVFRNLLKNAVEHNDGTVRRVTVSATDDDGTVTVRVADDGPGIPDDQKDVIFREGEKGLDSEGTGLGLYLVETLVDRYGGSVRVVDNEPRGSVFAVELPTVE